MIYPRNHIPATGTFGSPASYNAAGIHKVATEADVTTLLLEWNGGNEQARDKLIPLLYGELRRMANRYLRSERSGATLQPTALVHEAYVRLVKAKMPDWQSRSHFLGVAALLMRQLVVERARRNNCQKRGGGAVRMQLNEALTFAPEASGMILELDLALQALAAFDERKSRIIELRFFGGMTVDEVARAMDLSVATVGREQRMAEAWLHREMQNHGG